MTVTPLGVKRLCPSCGARFYDLNKHPAQCPKCEHRFDPNAHLRARRRSNRGPADHDPSAGDLLVRAAEASKAAAAKLKARAQKNLDDEGEDIPLDDIEDIDPIGEDETLEQIEDLDDIDDIEEIDDEGDESMDDDIVLEDEDVVDPLIDTVDEVEAEEAEEEEAEEDAPARKAKASGAKGKAQPKKKQ